MQRFNISTHHYHHVNLHFVDCRKIYVLLFHFLFVQWSSSIATHDTQDVSAPFMSESDLAKSVNIKNTPTIFLIGSNGEILARHIGIFEDDQEINEFWNSA
tara:strand:+ start:387 stop:689 length:303 start_codon:yes stop_codon:yes gene_type:complete